MGVGKTLMVLMQAFFLGGVLLKGGLTKSIFFALFWVFTIATLIILIRKKEWSSSEWIGFGAFATSTITGVLLSLRILYDPTGVGVPVIGLLLVTATLYLQDDDKKVKIIPPKPPIIIIDEPKTKKTTKRATAIKKKTTKKAGTTKKNTQKNTPKKKATTKNSKKTKASSKKGSNKKTKKNTKK